MSKKRPLNPQEIACSDFLKKAISETPLTQQQIADKVGVSQGQLWQWANRRLPVPARRAQALADALSFLDPVDPSSISAEFAERMSEIRTQLQKEDEEWALAELEHIRRNPPPYDALFDGPTPPTAQPDGGLSESETPEGYVRFPLLEGFAGMGRGDYVGDYPEIVDFVEVTREWASHRLRGVPLEVVRVITGRGDSMRGQYDDGDLVFVDSRTRQFEADAAYVYRWNGRVQIKRLQLVGKDLVRILSKNSEYPPIDVPLGDLEIGGRALAAWTLKEF
ncbi:LexA family transcriptional regulator [Dyella japonica]|uniref:Phage repressor protein C with HTH and peptisase S24 domain n=1 Tax=Dyella japonica TaxID=231455 RepID=A0ABV2K1W6_9GAMM